MVIWNDINVFIWTPNANYVSIGTAVQLLEEKDIQAQSDAEVKEFLSGCLTHRTAIEQDAIQITQNIAMWEIAYAQAASMGYDQVSANVIFGKAQRNIILSHLFEYLQMFISKIEEGVDRSRLRIGVFDPVILLLFSIVGALIRPSLYSLTGITILFFHWFHFFISMINQAERRYIWSTEIFFLIGVTLLIYNLSTSLQYWLRHFRDKRSGIRG